MTAYLIRRGGTSIVILFGIAIFVFILLHAVFPSPAIIVLGPKAQPAAIKAWNAANGFNSPVIVQFFRYVGQVLRGNLGYSYKLNQSVAALFGERWARSLYLSGISLTLAVLISIPLASTRQRGGTASAITWPPAWPSSSTPCRTSCST